MSYLNFSQTFFCEIRLVKLLHSEAGRCCCQAGWLVVGSSDDPYLKLANYGRKKKSRESKEGSKQRTQFNSPWLLTTSENFIQFFHALALQYYTQYYIYVTLFCCAYVTDGCSLFSQLSPCILSCYMYVKADY